MKYIVLSEDDANKLLGLLSDLPIRYLTIVKAVQELMMENLKDSYQSNANHEDLTHAQY